ncbi:glycoside hydrolase family 6 protein [Actinomadura harenae]|uniref:Glucanase n=1 Tax=Actinomadura harenae TaxID=2483351 RepID=A0A3M2LWU1_9ACTN|nr:glycoside hydrolase family 6 protein [Actinomadura harenae]RMI41682.1 endoglucanase [Actinomadura harenae]
MRRVFPLVVATVSVGAVAVGAAGCSSGGSGGARLSAADAGAAAAASPFYVDPGTQAAAWVKAHPKDARAARIRASIVARPGAKWFGNWSGDITRAVSGYVGAARSQGKTPVLVAYNITDRDCGGASRGGAGSPAAYRTWISKFAAAIGNRPAIVVIEPDAVAQLDCLPKNAQAGRIALLKYATQQFKGKATRTRAYLDGGNAHWVAAATMAGRLDAAGVKNVRGFSVNVSNFFTTAESAAYAKKVDTALSSKYHYARGFVIDTSRNGHGGTPGKWCNPAGAKLGAAPRAGGSGSDALLWVKVPGESDGPCGTAPKVQAGTFDPGLAMRLINGR